FSTHLADAGIYTLSLHDALPISTGQTGIFIEGWGTAVDAVVADFIAGAAEELVLKAAPGADVVLVEGQGSINHPGYSPGPRPARSEEHTSELQSRSDLVCRLLLE